jgi:hypothetical protein
MKLFFLFVCLGLMSLNAFSGAGGHGGDPFEVYASDFPDAKKLKRSITLITNKIQASKYSDDFKASLQNEIKLLTEKKKFYYLDSIIVIPMMSDYKAPVDLRAFAGLGAMTGHTSGDPIYFSKKSLKLSANNFAKLLLHELIHHLVSQALTEDEDFVEALAQSIISGNNDKALNVALKYGIYLKSTQLNTAQLWDALILMREWREKCQSAVERDKDFCRNLDIDFEEKYPNVPMVKTTSLSILNHNLSDGNTEKVNGKYPNVLIMELPIERLFNAFGWSITWRENGVNFNLHQTLPELLKKLYDEAGIPNKFVDDMGPKCGQIGAYYYGSPCPGYESMKLKDFIN